ncbi:MAG: ankyrin repeat domain-containing protein [Nitrospinaceae bacterium]|nr:ankyrin repeat domain-containing protein [Nitrospinaceae bacterium]
MIGPLVANTWWNAMKNGDLALGRIPLHFAALDGLNEIVELLIVEGANVNAKDHLGKNPLDWANKSGSDGNEVADHLRKHGGKTGEELKAEGN